jgi:hypothetical protein
MMAPPVSGTKDGDTGFLYQRQGILPGGLRAVNYAGLPTMEWDLDHLDDPEAFAAFIHRSRH